MGAIVAARFNPVIRAFSQRLRGRESQEGRAHSLHAKAADHAQRHAEASDPMADANNSGGLTEKTVAVPFSFLLCFCPAMPTWRFIQTLSVAKKLPFWVESRTENS